MSRDPIQERGFGVMQTQYLSRLLDATVPHDGEVGTLLYIYLHNQSINRVDPVGLDDCKKCGRAVDSAVSATKADVTRRFHNLGAWGRFVNCKPWKYPGGSLLDAIKASSGWDMSGVGWKWRTVCGPGSGVACGTPEDCQETVMLDGGCYKSWDVNYLLFGWLCDLCGISSEQMIGEIALWKMVKQESDEQAIAFALAGRNGAAIPAPPEQYEECKDCGYEVGREVDLTSTWPHIGWVL